MISLSARPTGAKRVALGPLALTAFALAGLSPSVLAQDKLGREIRFVRALAKDLSFIELAKSEAERLEAEFTGASDQDRIAQLTVEVSYYGARSRSDRNLQRTLFKETVEKSRELVDRTSDPDVKLEAMKTLANASQDFGQFLTQELEIAREEDPTSVADLQEQVITVLRTGIKACDEVRNALVDERDDPQKNIDYGVMWMNQGKLQREQARADKENRDVLVDRAIELLEEMVLDYGEESALGLRGLFEIAQCYEVKGDVDEAIVWFGDTIEQITNSLDAAADGRLDISPSMQGFLFGMMQEVAVRKAETMMREGAAGTAEVFANFREQMKKYGEEGLDVFDIVSPTYGHLMLLAEARFKAESGEPAKVQEALALTQRINDLHPADYVGVRAKAVLSDILGAQKGLVSGALLMEVGKGALQKREYETAVKNLRTAIDAMSDEELKQHGIEAYTMLADAFRFSQRPLEAMLTMADGLNKFGVKKSEATNDELERQHELSSDLADDLDGSVARHKRITSDDPYYNSLWAEWIELAAEYSSGGANKLAYKEGVKLFQDRSFEQAATELAKVQPDYIYYEQARVLLSRAQAATGDFAASRATADEYRQYVEKKELGPNETGRRQVRKAAQASAAFNDVQMAYHEARGNSDYGLERNLEKYPAAIEAVQVFLNEHADNGKAYLPQVLAYLGRLHVDTGALDKAEQAYAQLKSENEAARASRLATEIFQEYEKQIDGLDGELSKLIANSADAGELADIRSEIATARRRLTALGTDYIQNSPQPQLAILVATMQAWERLGEWQSVAAVADKTLALYGDDTDAGRKNIVDKLVRPMVGEALLQQRQFQKAYEMLDAAEKANPRQWELKRQLARALGGWFEFDERTARPSIEPGLDRPVEAYIKYYADRENAYRVWATRPEVEKYSLDWYRFHWEAYWFARQAAKKDSKYETTAQTLYGIARSTNDFGSLRQLGDEGEKLLNYFRTNRP